MQNFGQANGYGMYRSLSVATPGPTPGSIWIPGVEELQNVVNWTEDVIYDCEQLPAAIAAGQTFNFFRNQNIAGVPKTLSQWNMQTQNQLPSRWRAVVHGIHIHPQNGAPADDIRALMQRGYFRLVTGGQKIQREGPLWTFPSCFGQTGVWGSDGALAPREVAFINNGVPSPAAMGKMALPINLFDEETFQGVMQFDAPTALTAAMFVYVVLRAYVMKPVM